MGNNDHGAVASHQDVFQPANGIDVQMVGGLVQKQDIRIREQRLGQQNTQFPARRNSAHGAVVLFQGNIQAQQQFASAGIGGIAVHLGELHFQVRHGHAVFLAHFSERVDTITLGFYTPELFVAHNDRINHRAVLVGKLVLAQLTQPLILVHHDLAGRRFQVAAKDFHERGLAAAIGADQTVAVAIAEFDGHIFEKGFGPELHGNVRGGYQE